MMTKEENEKLKYFVTYYKTQYNKISHTEYDIKVLSIEIEGLLNDLIEKRREEEIFTTELITKYGEDELKNKYKQLTPQQ